VAVAYATIVFEEYADVCCGCVCLNRTSHSLVSWSSYFLAKTVRMENRSAQKRNRRHAASSTAKQEQAKDVSAPIRVNRMRKDAVSSPKAVHAQDTEDPTSITLMTCAIFWRKVAYLVHVSINSTPGSEFQA
jgi:hypothetical protein